MNMHEGSINVRSEAVKVMSIVKEIIRGLYNKSYVKGGVIGAGKVVNEDEFKKVLGYINNEIKHRLKDSGVISCNILFVTWLKDGETRGGYVKIYNLIVIDAYDYFTEFDKDWGVYRYRNFSKMRFDDMSRTIEHELIHHEQDKRSKGKFLNNNKDVDISDGEMNVLMKKKSKVAPYVSDEVYIGRIKYYNDVAELDTFANNVADKYIQYKVKEMRTMINFRVKHENEEVRNYSAEEVREYVLRGILRSNEGRFGSKLDIQRKLIDLSDGYEFLTVDNKKRYWKYLFKALLVNRFEPMIFVK
jgi:TolB-like protein